LVLTFTLDLKLPFGNLYLSMLQPGEHAIDPVRKPAIGTVLISREICLEERKKEIDWSSLYLGYEYSLRYRMALETHRYHTRQSNNTSKVYL